jgi:hypothetical protein
MRQSKRAITAVGRPRELFPEKNGIQVEPGIWESLPPAKWDRFYSKRKLNSTVKMMNALIMPELIWVNN